MELDFEISECLGLGKTQGDVHAGIGRVLPRERVFQAHCLQAMPAERLEDRVDSLAESFGGQHDFIPQGIPDPGRGALRCQPLIGALALRDLARDGAVFLEDEIAPVARFVFAQLSAQLLQHRLQFRRNLRFDAVGLRTESARQRPQVRRDRLRVLRFELRMKRRCRAERRLPPVFDLLASGRHGDCPEVLPCRPKQRAQCVGRCALMPLSLRLLVQVVVARLQCEGLLRVELDFPQETAARILQGHAQRPERGALMVEMVCPRGHRMPALFEAREDAAGRRRESVRRQHDAIAQRIVGLRDDFLQILLLAGDRIAQLLPQ